MGRRDAVDMRSSIENKLAEISRQEALQFLQAGQVGHVATVGEDGYPYVIPFVYVHDGGDKLYLHIGNIGESHFWSNVKNHPKVSVEVSERGDLHPGKMYAGQSALVYTSIVLFGQVKHITDGSMKEWFFDRLLEKYGDSKWEFERVGYRILHNIELFEVEIEKITGKGIYH